MSNSHLRPTVRQLEYLIAVAEEANFSRAAARCHVTQPSLSSQIRQLELLIGQDVFERTPRGVLVTAIGEELIEIAKDAMQAVDRFVARSQVEVGVLTGTLRLGAVSTITPYLMPQVLAELSVDFPELKVELQDDTAERLKEQLVAGELDLIVAPLPAGLGGCEEVELAEDPFVLVAPTASSLGDLSEPVSLEVLRETKLLLLDDPHCFRGQALEVCNQANCSADTSIHATSIHSLVQMVRRGLGATLLPALSLELELGWLRDVRLKEFRDPIPGRTLGAIWRKHSPQVADFRVLASILMRHAEAATSWQPREEA